MSTSHMNAQIMSQGHIQHSNLNVYPWTPRTHGKMKVLTPQNMGEITPKNWDVMGSHGIQTLYPYQTNISNISKGRFETLLRSMSQLAATGPSLRDVLRTCLQKHPTPIPMKVFLKPLKPWKLQPLQPLYRSRFVGSQLVNNTIRTHNLPIFRG